MSNEKQRQLGDSNGTQELLVIIESLQLAVFVVEEQSWSRWRDGKSAMDYSLEASDTCFSKYTDWHSSSSKAESAIHMHGD